MRGYPQEFRNRLVAKALLPNGKPAAELAKEHGITYQTLRQWIKKTAKGVETVSEKQTGELSLLEKKKILFDTKALEGEALGEFLRANGLHSHQLEEFERQIESALTPKGPGRPRLDPVLVGLRKENKDLQKELRRKDKALAEQTTIIMLQKKIAARINYMDEASKPD